MFKVGQTVWDVRKGKGVVRGVNNGQLYPIAVDFEGTICCYTRDGEYNRNDKYPSLYFSEPKIEAATEPPFEPKFEKGSVVVIKRRKDGGLICVGTVLEDDHLGISTQDKCRWGKISYSFFKIGEQVY